LLPPPQPCLSATRCCSWLGKTPGWRNGKRWRLKSVCPEGLAGSNPAPGTRLKLRRIVGASVRNKTMYSRDTVDLALLLSGLSILDREKALICEVSVRAIRHWRYGSRRRERTGPDPRCPRCGDQELDASAYAYLLGLYLGDGHIVLGRRGVYALSITCCDGWPGLIDAAERAIASVMPTSSVFRRARIGCHDIKSTSKLGLVGFRSTDRAGNISAGSSWRHGSR
jgi:hypothetical protein